MVNVSSSKPQKIENNTCRLVHQHNRNETKRNQSDVYACPRHQLQHSTPIPLPLSTVPSPEKHKKQNIKCTRLTNNASCERVTRRGHF